MEDFLKPGIPDDFLEFDKEEIPNVLYLAVENNLSEFATSVLKSEARNNLEVLSENEVDSKIKNSIADATNIINTSLEGLQTQIDKFPNVITNQLKNYREITNTIYDKLTTTSNYKVNNNNDVTNKDYVDSKIKSEFKNYDLELNKILQNFAEECASLSKVNELNKEIQNLIKTIKRNIVKNNIENTFLKAQHYSGIISTNDTLTNKKYVDNQITECVRNSKIQIENNLRNYLIERFSDYAKVSDVYKKDNTYSKWELDAKISKLVDLIIKSELSNYQSELTQTLLNIIEDNKNVIRIDGSVPFTAPLKGIPAINDNELVTLSLVNNLNKWVTSGPIETTVGFMEDNSEVPTVMTLQQIMDSIFYGKKVSITAPESIIINESTEITICVHGSNIDVGQLYQNGELIRVFTKEELDGDCITITTNPITEDSEFIFEVIYDNGTSIQESTIIKVVYPVFVGTFPWMKPAGETSMKYLQDRCKEDESSELLNVKADITSISHKFNFLDVKGGKIVIAMPESYSDLKSMDTLSQSFGIEAFSKINLIPYEVINGLFIPYKLFIYDLKLSKITQTITFNF